MAFTAISKSTAGSWSAQDNSQKNKVWQYNQSGLKYDENYLAYNSYGAVATFTAQTKSTAGSWSAQSKS